MRVAVAKYPVGTPAGFAAFADKQARLLEEAKAAGAQLAVLPEYLSLELAAMFAPAIRGDLSASLAALQPFHAAWCELFGAIADRLDLHLVAGTFLVEHGDGRYRNRAYWFSPGGRAGFQEKLQLTGFEKQPGSFAAGKELKVFGINSQRAGMAVCYDAEFPLPVRAQAEAGARLLVVPSCTDTDAGATRVRVGCLARALENRCFVAQSVTAGVAAWSPALDENTGEAAIYAPMDRGLPADGVLAQTQGGQVWAVADLDFAVLEASRANAQVANDRDWPGQWAPGIVRASLEGWD